MNDPKAQIVEKLKASNSILVTISMNPSVDQIAACIGMTLILNKYKKSTTAVFSGKVPSVLNFLKPTENLSKNTDSLRDFIIALDKSKADKLRYKVEDDVVKIFITPFKTSITEKDLKYSAGDFNVDLILALGVSHQQDLDTAITAHGRIFHDAVTMSINNKPKGDFGVANWEDVEASSLSELIAELVDQLDPSLLDAEIATALLTGIVAETGRFSNDKTHPRTLTVSSRLLQAGADQQLVNNQLQDLIGVVVNLEAGSQIAPTADTSKEPLHHIDGGEELLVDEHGEFVAKPAEEPAEKVEEPAAEPEQKPEVEVEAEKPEEPEFIMTDVVPTPAPVLDEAADKEANEGIKDQPANAKDDGALNTDAEKARQAVQDAFAAHAEETAAPVDAVPITAEVVTTEDPTQLDLPVGSTPQQHDPINVVQPFPAPDSSPKIETIAPNQPSYANPNPKTQYDMPVAPEHEPAPLVMSPADQAFTMPLPPSSSMSGSSAQQQDASQPPAAPQLGFPPATTPAVPTTPPPLPPPLPPSQR